MDKNKYMLLLDSVMKKEGFMRFFIITLLLICLIQTFTIINMYKNYKIVFLPPFGATQEFSVEGKVLSNSYFEQISKLITSTLYTVQPTSAEAQLTNLLPLFSAESYHTYKVELLKMAKDIKDNDLSYVFYYTGFDINEQNVLKIRGTRKSIIGNKVVDVKNIVVKVNYRVNEQSKFEIIELEKMQ